MSPRALPSSLVGLSLLACLLSSSPLHAELDAGQECRLSGPLVVKLRNSVQGSVETELSAGTPITITEPGLQFSRLMSGEVEALAPTSALEAVCAAAVERCVLQDAIKMATERSGRKKQKVFKVKKGATLSVLERGKQRSRVVVGGVLGRVNTDHLDEKCKTLPATKGSEASGKPRAGGGGGTSAAVIAPAPAGVRVAVLAFSLAPSGSAVDARAFEDDLTSALLKRRGDVMGPRDPRPDAKARLSDAKKHLSEAAQIGAQMNVPYVITGQLGRDGEHRVLSLSVYDIKAGRVVRTLRARPTYHKQDPWADVTSGFLNEVLPGGTKYVPPQGDEEPEPVPAAPLPKASAKGAWSDGPPWYTNGLAYTSLGAGVLLATGGALTGYWASTDVAARNSTTLTDGSRRELANAAMTKAIVADSLYATAALAAVASVVFFVTGLDWDGV